MTPLSPKLVYKADIHDLTKGRLAQMEDGELVARAMSGQDVAFEVLMDKYAPIVVGFLAGKTRRPCDVEDLAQEVFIAAFRALPNLKKSERFGPWLMRITRNRLIDFYRASARHPQFVSPYPGEDEADRRDWERIEDPGPKPDHLAAQTEIRQVVLQEIGRLSDKYRMVLYLRLIGERTSEDIARELGILPVTVRMRIYRGLNKLRKALLARGLSL